MSTFWNIVLGLIGVYVLILCLLGLALAVARFPRVVPILAAALLGSAVTALSLLGFGANSLPTGLAITLVAVTAMGIIVHLPQRLEDAEELAQTAELN